MKKVTQTDQWRPAPSVGWYDPLQLLQTGSKVASATLFAENADGRLVQPLFDPTPEPFPEHLDAAEAPRDSLTIDYIADTGDAFDPTYTVLYHATRSQTAADTLLEAGQVLLLGGDQVYPTASDAEYDRRLVRPLRMASGDMTDDVAATLYAIPGNHDWYDNLVAFRRLFIGGQRIGRFLTAQKRSYFVLKLPHDWWVFAPDVQLGSELDSIQYAYLQQCAQALSPEAKVILCTAEPHWVSDNERAQSHSREPQRSRLLILLEQALDGNNGRIRCVLAGDLHHYRRHLGKVGNKKRNVQLITAGGGGAFLHPTHGWRDGSDRGLFWWKESDTQRVQDSGYVFKKAYPDPAVSRRLTRSLPVVFLVKNPGFLWATAVMYGLMSLQVLLGARMHCLAEPKRCAELAFNAAGAPGVMTLAFLICFGFVAFTDTSRTLYRWVAGTLHGLTHVAFAIAIPLLTLYWWGAEAVGAADTSRCSVASVFLHLGQVLCSLSMDTAVGAVIGGLLMGFYLFVSLNLFGRHRNETFSALRSPRYKSFLRIVINAREARVYAFGIDQPPGAWQWAAEKPRARTEDPSHEERSEPLPRLHPEQAAPEPFLIESFSLDP